MLAHRGFALGATNAKCLVWVTSKRGEGRLVPIIMSFASPLAQAQRQQVLQQRQTCEQASHEAANIRHDSIVGKHGQRGKQEVRVDTAPYVADTLCAQE
jgi:hypothetical protein